MRGKVVIVQPRISAGGITPAYAGKSICYQQTTNKAEDHPRLCGEKISHALFIMLAMGSPPPMRGKEKHRYNFADHCRITPAYAGKRLQMPVTLLPARDHPRLCGEKPPPAKCNCYKTGSPPPMRGKAACATPTDRITGITPAYAGKSH